MHLDRNGSATLWCCATSRFVGRNSLELYFDRCVVIFFFKQKTAYEMRISDWSSDVCSSDLDIAAVVEQTAKLCESLGHTVVPVPAPYDAAGLQAQTAPLMGVAFAASVQARLAQLGRELADDDQIGRAHV